MDSEASYLHTDEPKKEQGSLRIKVIQEYQRALLSSDPAEQQEAAYGFYRILMTALNHPIEKQQDAASELDKLFRDSTQMTHELHLGSGTAGLRIFFQDFNIFTNEVDSNGRKRWMRYPKPSDYELAFAGQYWKNFVDVFGGEIVDMLPETGTGETQG